MRKRNLEGRKTIQMNSITSFDQNFLLFHMFCALGLHSRLVVFQQKGFKTCVDRSHRDALDRLDLEQEFPFPL